MIQECRNAFAPQARLVELVAPSFDPTDAAAWTLRPEP